MEGKETGSGDEERPELKLGPVLDITKPREKHNTPTAKRGTLSDQALDELDFEFEEPPEELDDEVEAYRA